MYKRKAVESAQTAADLKLHLDKYHAQLKEVQVAVAEKTSALQQQGFKFKRIQVGAVDAVFRYLYLIFLTRNKRMCPAADIAHIYGAMNKE